MISILPSFVFAKEVPPSAPLKLEFADLGDLTIRLSWDTPESEIGGIIQGYNIYYIDNNKNNFSQSGILDNFFVTEKLTLGLSYDFWVTAYNDFGESPESEKITVNLAEDVTPPVITKGPEVSSITEKSVNVYWETDEYSSTVLNFDVHGSNPHQSINIKGLALNHDISLTGLLPCTTYFYNVSSSDTSSNNTTTEISSFKTTGCLGSILDEAESNLGLPENPLSLNFERNGIEVSLLPDSFDIESIFQIKKLDIVDVDANVGCPAGKKPIGGQVYDVKLLEEYDKEAPLLKPATITISYDQEDVSGVDESLISMFHYTEDSGWVKLNSCTLDTQNNEITCETSSFSKFMISFGQEYKCKPLLVNLSFGNYNNDIFFLQEFLNKNGFMDSFKDTNLNREEEKRLFDGKTFKALREFQKSSGIKGLERFFGFLGPKTRAIINE